jgi:hypothetical protein
MYVAYFAGNFTAVKSLIVKVPGANPIKLFTVVSYGFLGAKH